MRVHLLGTSIGDVYNLMLMRDVDLSEAVEAEDYDYALAELEAHDVCHFGGGAAERFAVVRLVEGVDPTGAKFSTRGG